MNRMFKLFSAIAVLCLSTNISHAIPDDGNRGASSSSSKSSSSSSSSTRGGLESSKSNSSSSSTSSSTRGGLESSKSSSTSSSSQSSSSTSSSTRGGLESSKSSSTSSAASSRSDSGGSDRSDSNSNTFSATRGGLESSKSTATTSSSTSSMTRGEASKYTSSMQTTPSPTMTRGEASKYTSNIQPSLPKSSTDVAAAKAGMDYMSRYTTGTLGAGSLGYQQAQERLNYRGVVDYYTKNNITGGTVPMGPMAAKYGNYAVANDVALGTIDALYRNGSANVVTAGSGISEKHMRELVGTKLYDELSNAQKYGLYNSNVAVGNLSSVINDPLVGGYYDPSKNVTVIDTNSLLSNTPAGMEKVTVHELQHAGDYTTYNKAQEILGDPKSSAKDKQLAQETVDALQGVIDGYVYEDVADNKPNMSTAFTMDTPSAVKAQEYKEYLANVAEARSFSSTPANRTMWAQGFAAAAGVSIPEALDLLDAMAEAEGLLDDNSVQNQFIDRFGSN